MVIDSRDSQLDIDFPATFRVPTTLRNISKHSPKGFESKNHGADHHRQLAADDNDGQDRVGSLNTAIPKTLLADLFDFTTDEWADKYNRFTKIGYDEEMELYDLLEIDAEGGG